MNLRILASLVILTFGTGIAHAATKQAKPAEHHYHCDCGEICAKAAPNAQCKIKSCNGKNAPQAKAQKSNTRSSTR